MPFVPVINTCMVEMRAVRNAQKVENRVMVDMGAAPNRIEMEALATAVWNWWQDTYAGVLTGDVNLREVVVTDISQVDGLQVTYAPASNITGGINNTALPNEVSFCVSLRSQFRGRSARGRFYSLSVAQIQMADANNLTTGAAGAFVGTVQQLINAINDLGKHLVIVSYRHNNAPRVGGPVKYIVDAAVSVDTLVDSMKRRKPGVGA